MSLKMGIQNLFSLKKPIKKFNYFLGGLCLQNPNTEFGYVCKCPLGFDGEKCERAINPCQVLFYFLIYFKI